VDVGWDGRFLHYVVLESEFAKRRCHQDDPNPLALQPVRDRAVHFFDMPVCMNENGWADRTCWNSRVARSTSSAMSNMTSRGCVRMRSALPKRL